MECNKEEAIRAKSIAEKKMQLKDFSGARKLILTAQRLYPDLENASQMLTVCEVHCSAEIKLSGSEDWYGILQVDPTADDALIKKQYRKLALLLHPDKNKFAGAEAAFKLVGEAHRVLSDRSNRSVYDFKRTASVKTTIASAPKKSRKQPSAPSAPPPFSNVYQQNQATHQQQPQPVFASMTFWTVCPSCGIRYQYYRTIINKALRCQSCLNPFIATDIEAQGVHGTTNFSSSVNKPAFPQQKNVRQQSKNQETSAHSVPETVVFGPGRSQDKNEPVEMKDGNAGKEKVKVEESKTGSQKQKSPNEKMSPGNAKQKRGRKMTVESESESDDSDIETTVGRSNGSKTGVDHTPRRSSRQRQSVSYTEKNSDGEDSKNPTNFKRLKKKKSSSATDELPFSEAESDARKVEVPVDETSEKEGTFTRQDSPKKKNFEGTLRTDSGDPESQDSKANGVDTGEPKVNMTFLDYPDPEFYDFDKGRSAECFSVGQIWSLYDFLDGMPRFYAIIKSISSSEFKVRFTWLEYFPVSKAEKDWSEEELPVGCGEFKLGKTETAEDNRVFSHLVPWSKGQKKNHYLIYPLKGQIWALFKNWDLKWSLDPDQHRLFDYEVVEIISDCFSADEGIEVFPLVKVKGFVSLFCRGARDSVRIPRDELLRFSHMVPSYTMTGNEREGIPRGFFELDYASLPPNVEQTCSLVTLDEAKFGPEAEDHRKENGVVHLEHDKEPKAEIVNSNSPSPMHEDKESKANEANPNPVSPLRVVYEDSEFHDFEADRVKEKFQAGQIWALYCEDDGFPKYYALVKKVEFAEKDKEEDFSVHLNWLEACPQTEPETKWLENGLPLGCGRFRPIAGKEGKQTYSSVETFSHLVQPLISEGSSSRRQHLYDIYPRVGEVWAVFRNWSADWQPSDLEQCSEKADYEIVEIASTSKSLISGQLLEKAKGHKVAFKPLRTGGEGVKMEISGDEFLRFSHRIPSFRVVDDLLELDPASVPEILLCSS